MLPAVFRCEFAGQFAGFRGQTAPGGCGRIVGFLSRGALLLFQKRLNVSFPGDIVNSGQAVLRGQPAFLLSKAALRQKTGGVRESI